MLVGTFQVQVYRAGQFRATGPDAVMRHAGVHPHVHRVLRRGVVSRLGAQQLRRVEIEPGFEPVGLD